LPAVRGVRGGGFGGPRLTSGLFESAHRTLAGGPPDPAYCSISSGFGPFWPVSCSRPFRGPGLALLAPRRHLRDLAPLRRSLRSASPHPVAFLARAIPSRACRVLGILAFAVGGSPPSSLSLHRVRDVALPLPRKPNHRHRLTCRGRTSPCSWGASPPRLSEHIRQLLVGILLTARRAACQLAVSYNAVIGPWGKRPSCAATAPLLDHLRDPRDRGGAGPGPYRGGTSPSTTSPSVRWGVTAPCAWRVCSSSSLPHRGPRGWRCSPTLCAAGSSLAWVPGKAVNAPACGLLDL